VAGEDDVVRLMTATLDSEYRIPILIGLATGMRRGEVVGLKWEDFSLERRTLTVRRSLCQLRGAGVIEKSTKTGKARVVVLPENVADELAAHRESQQRLAAQPACDPPELDMHEYGGHRLSPDVLTKAFRRIACRIGLQINYHGLRHTQATMLIMAGVPAKVVSERLGHSTIQITRDIYAHVLPHMQEQAAEVIGEILSRKPKIKLVGN